MLWQIFARYIQHIKLTTRSISMSADLLRPPAHISQSDALRLSQQAPSILRSHSPWALPWPFSLLLTNDSPEIWAIHENLFHSCLRTGDDDSALTCLEKLKERFGADNERVMGLVGLYHEAVAPDQKALSNVLKSYEAAIEQKPTNIVVRKRHIALLKSIGRLDGAIAALVDLLDASPVDAEAWAELAELYFTQGFYAQAVYSMEEALIVMPNAWNMHARLGEMIYVSVSNATSDSGLLRDLGHSLKCFCRSVELCDDYLRGHYGVKSTTTKLKRLQGLEASHVATRNSVEEEWSPPSIATVQHLNEVATVKLAEIIRKASTQTTGWQGYDESEIIAARELLDRDDVSNAR